MEENSPTANPADPKDQQPAANPTEPEAKEDGNPTGADSDASKATDKSGDDDAGDKKPEAKKTDEGGTPAPKFDSDLDEWAEKTGRGKPTTDRERELFQEIRNNARDFSREKADKESKQAAEDISKAVDNLKPDNKQDDDDDGGDDLEKDVKGLKAELAEQKRTARFESYFREKSVSTEESKVMGEILKEKVEKATSPEAKQSIIDFWTSADNLEDWHLLAKARMGVSADKSVIEQEAAKKERERIAKESQAAGGNRNASTTGEGKKGGYNRHEFLKSDD